MIEIEHVTDIEADAPAQSSAKEQETTGTKQEEPTGKSGSEATEHEPGDAKKQNKNRVLPNISNPNDLQIGDIFYGSIKSRNKNGKSTKIQGIFKVTDSDIKGDDEEYKELTLCGFPNTTYKLCSSGIRIASIKRGAKKQKIEDRAKQLLDETDEKSKEEKKPEEKKEKKDEKNEKQKPKGIQFSFNMLSPEDKVKTLIKAGMNNIWMVGPAGCGKSTIARNTSKELDVPYLCISCGIGTSATEFVGYKYPNREATKFAEFYAKKSIILIDEMTALDPSVAQVINAALANGEIETTTGTVLRHPECVIIATSNTFGNGADRQYVANNQLDASTIDRFIGAIVNVDYSSEYESQFDKEVVEYVKALRSCIKKNSLRRIASTRMIQSADKMKKIGISDWKELIVTNWSDIEKKILSDYIRDNSIENTIANFLKKQKQSA